MFQNGDFFGAWLGMRLQLRKCCGDYSLQMGAGDLVELITFEGEIIPESELSEMVVGRIKMFAEFADSQKNNSAG